MTTRVSGVVIVKLAELVALVVGVDTFIGPVVAPRGIVALSWVAETIFQTEAVMPLN